MGLMKCSEHGLQPLSFASPKVAKCISNKTNVNFKIENLLLNSFDNKKSVHTVDEEFANYLRNKYSSINDEIITKNDEESFEIFSEFSPVCKVCLQELLNK